MSHSKSISKETQRAEHSCLFIYYMEIVGGQKLALLIPPPLMMIVFPWYFLWISNPARVFRERTTWDERLNRPICTCREVLIVLRHGLDSGSFSSVRAESTEGHQRAWVGGVSLCIFFFQWGSQKSSYSHLSHLQKYLRFCKKTLTPILRNTHWQSLQDPSSVLLGQILWVQTGPQNSCISTYFNMTWSESMSSQTSQRTNDAIKKGNNAKQTRANPTYLQAAPVGINKNWVRAASWRVKLTTDLQKYSFNNV